MTPDFHGLISQMAAELDHCQQLSAAPPLEGEVGELVAALGSKDRWTQLTDAQVDRAAALLEQLSAPANALPLPATEGGEVS